MSAWHRLTVTSVVEETTADRSLVFGLPAALGSTFRWRAGQHLVVRRCIDGEEHRRCYSISAPPGEPLRITVRKVRAGRLSGDLHREVSAGSEVQVSAPCGSFCLDTSPTAYRTHYFFAAGSGITPIFSMLGAVLAAEPYSEAHLLYGNRNADRILFRSELDGLREAHGSRFGLTLCLTSAP